MILRMLLAAGALLAFALFAASPAYAQDFTIVNATVVLGDGSEPIQNGMVRVRNGRIAYAGPQLEGEWQVTDSDLVQESVPDSDRIDIRSITTIDAQDAWVTPGLVAAVTNLGLWDVGAVEESNDTRAASSPFSAALDVAPAVNPNSMHIAISRAAGITRAATVTRPSSSIFGGQGAIIDLGADADPVMRARAFQYAALGEAGARLAGGSRVSAHALLRNALREARQYGEDSQISGSALRPGEVRTGDDLPIDPRLIDTGTDRGDDVLLSRFDAAALVPVVNGSQPLYIHVERASDIRAALALRQEFPRLDLVLVGVSEGWLVANEIAAAGVPVIADGLDDLPASFEQLAATQSNIGRMVDAGVKVAINAASMEQPRYLPQYAGNLVSLTRVPGPTGLTWGEAFAAISSVPAEIIGLDGRAGTLTPGAAGDVVIWDGDPLEVSSAPLRVFIDGIEQPRDNHQTELRERYRDLDESDLPKAYDW